MYGEAAQQYGEYSGDDVVTHSTAPGGPMEEQAAAGPAITWPLPARTGVKLMTALGAFFIFLTFTLNWELNRFAFEVVQRSELLRDIGTAEGALVALALSAFLAALPELRKQLNAKLTVWHLIGGAIGVLLFILILTGDANLVGNLLVQTFVLVFYASPLIFGLFGVLHHKPVHIVIYAMFSFFIAGGTKNPLSELPGLMVFAVFFILSLEVGESSIRCQLLLEEKRLSEAHLAGFIDHYLRHLALFMTGAVVLTLITVNVPYVVGSLGLRGVAESAELGAFFGLAVCAFTVLGILGMGRFLHDRGHTKPYIARGARVFARLREKFGTPEETTPHVYEDAPTGRY